MISVAHSNQTFEETDFRWYFQNRGALLDSAKKWTKLDRQIYVESYYFNNRTKMLNEAKERYQKIKAERALEEKKTQGS
jgi:hypothetical protein